MWLQNCMCSFSSYGSTTRLPDITDRRSNTNTLTTLKELLRTFRSSRRLFCSLENGASYLDWLLCRPEHTASPFSVLLISTLSLLSLHLEHRFIIAKVIMISIIITAWSNIIISQDSSFLKPKGYITISKKQPP